MTLKPQPETKSLDRAAGPRRRLPGVRRSPAPGHRHPARCAISWKAPRSRKATCSTKSTLVEYKAALASARSRCSAVEATLVSVRVEGRAQDPAAPDQAGQPAGCRRCAWPPTSRAGRPKAAQANRDTAAISLDRTKVIASISGRIGRRASTPGALVTASQATAMTTIQQLDPAHVDLDQSTSEMERPAQPDRERKASPGAFAEGVQVELLTESGKAHKASKANYGFTDASVNEGTGSVSSRAIFSVPSAAAARDGCCAASSPVPTPTRSWCRSARPWRVNPSWGRPLRCFVEHGRQNRAVDAWTWARGWSADCGWCERAPRGRSPRASTARRRPVPARTAVKISSTLTRSDPATGLTVARSGSAWMRGERPRVQREE